MSQRPNLHQFSSDPSALFHPVIPAELLKIAVEQQRKIAFLKRRMERVERLLAKSGSQEDRGEGSSSKDSI
ncbi:hypothetical protein L596_020426 [Steinernema carpocapsae]|uniref:Uncharacterized protein n=1 Tax=Steinernema carpocapsae TaxID=34508 RepID=A0A4U5MTL0_STECR|nr:hypothetical protein L596_020426 [Steinernema carpocapsae]